MIELKRIEPRSKVAVLSPSSGIAGLFPWVADYGIARMEKLFEFEPIEYPTTRKHGSSPQDRAKDINAAFGNPEIMAIFSMIGGDDQIQLLKHLDPDLIKANPKPFFGYSDNTHLCNLLFNLGIPSFYGGSIMGEFAFNKAIPSITLQSIKWAVWDRGRKDIESAESINTIDLQWADKDLLEHERTFEKNTGYIWDGKSISGGTLWGGCLESLVGLTSSGNDTVFAQYDGDIILFFETSESMPPHWITKYYLMGLGERELFGRKIKGIVVGRPKTWDFDKQMVKEARQKYFDDQVEAIITTVRHYNRLIPIVLNTDIGHTSPQYIVPMGNQCTIDPIAKKLYFTY